MRGRDADAALLKRRREIQPAPACTGAFFKGGSWPFKVGGAPLEVQVHGRLRLDNLQAIRRAAADGMGLAYLPRWMLVDELADGRLHTVLGDFASAPSPIKAVYAAERLLARRAAVFIDFIAQRFAATPGLSAASS